MRWDIFCKVIDNHGDLGVCWRLCADLAARGEQVRLWVDDPAALRWMAPAGAPGVQVAGWDSATRFTDPGEVLVEAFGCDPAPEFIAHYAHRKRATGQKGLWINLEYLSAEAFVERTHGLPSPVMQGPGAGLAKYFFYPGFTPRTGGLLREPGLAARQAAFDAAAWLSGQGVPDDGARRVSLFCYEPAALGELLLQCARGPHATRLLVTSGRAAQATRAAIATLEAGQAGWNAADRLRLSWLPLLPQPDYDHLLWACDANFVRGEDSLVRALWAGRPFVWQLYPQHDDAHHAKLEAFLGQLAPPPAWAAFQRGWNGMSPGPLGRLDPPAWQEAARAFRQRLLGQTDLATQLLRFVSEKR
ncbi:MAG: elongation factor P maturation arginine rhamnosyltransferase EarP [Ramlibacter sp.]|nr:elongation factor P maturation arginine rhamnosyltransferase EarP [Ramlibacter sp.]